MQNEVVFDDNQNKIMTLDDLFSKCKEYIRMKKNLDLIEKAYNFSANHHEGQYRKSGEPYFQHPLHVAYMLAEMRTGPNTICAGLLHDVVEDTAATLDDVRKVFGDDIASLVDGLTKIGKLKYMTKEKSLEKTHQKMFLAMAKDVRVIIVKLIDRLHNMRTLFAQTPEKQKTIAKETLDLYAPLAHKLGMYRIKAELEELGLKYYHPDEYEKVKGLIENHKKNRDLDVSEMQNRIEKLLIDNKIQNFKLKGRIKNIYSVWKKMNDKSRSFEQIYDLLALRIIVNSIEDCYHVLGLIHGTWTPIPMRFKDYIATPKPNLYQSLHTTVVGVNGNIYEIQIRTYDMDEVAEMGIAAHWSYKEKDKNYSPEKEQREVGEKLRWFKEMVSYAEMGEEEDNDQLENIKEDIFSANVYVFTPKGDVIDMPNGATPLDFAYRIHTEVGNHTVGAIVNNKIVPLTYKLKTGDVVEIKTNKSFNGPTNAWLKIVKTAHAKHKISAILNKKKRDEFIERGRFVFDSLMQSNNNSQKLNDKMIKDTFQKVNISSLEEFYYEIGKGVVSDKAAYNKLFGEEEITDEMLLKQYNENVERRKRVQNSYGIIVDGLEKAQIKVAPCCHPILGDPIVGYVSKGSGVVVHRYECPNVTGLDTDRFIQVYWDSEEATRNLETCISILTLNRKNILTDVINALNSASISISSINNMNKRNGELLIRIKMFVKNVDQLDYAINLLYRINDIYEVERDMR